MTAPSDDVVGPLLSTMMPKGIDPIGLFRKTVIDRTCARCGCEYEWGVHVAYFAERVGFDEAQITSITSLTHGDATDSCWTDPARPRSSPSSDQLHDTSRVDDAAWAALAAHRSPEQILDVLLVAGGYHAISYAANGAQVDHEPWAPKFADFATGDA